METKDNELGGNKHGVHKDSVQRILRSEDSHFIGRNNYWRSSSHVFRILRQVRGIGFIYFSLRLDFGFQ